MKARARILACMISVLTLLAILLPTSMAFAQSDDNRAAGFALLGGMMLFGLICFALFYIYMALAVMTIANKTNTENAWLAWIPIANVVLLLMIARKPIWWIVLCLIPLVNIVIFIIVWMAVAEARNKPGWVGVLLILPVIGIFIPGYLAWSD